MPHSHPAGDQQPTLSFWRWLVGGTGAGAGLRRYISWWLLPQVAVGVVLAVLVPASIAQAAKTFLLPLAAVLVGLAFAWGGNAQALLQTPEIEQLSDHRPGGLEEYVYTYQAAILVILCALTVWGLGAVGVFDKVWPTEARPRAYFCTAVFLYFWACLSLRECWHVVLGAQLMLLTRKRIRRHKKNGR